MQLQIKWHKNVSKNYRPIIIIATVIRILSNVINEKVTQETQNYISKNHDGFSEMVNGIFILRQKTKSK